MTPANPRQSDTELRTDLVRVLRNAAHGFWIYADDEDRITREINMAVSSALEKVADDLEDQPVIRGIKKHMRENPR